MKNIFKTILTIAVASATLSSAVLIQAPKARAVSLTIQNPGFENPSVPQGTFTDPFNFFHFPNANPPVPGWQVYDPNNIIANSQFNSKGNFPFYGVFNPIPAAFNTPPPEGKNVAIFDSGYLPPGSGSFGLSQTLTNSLTANTNYTLKASVGNTQTFHVPGVVFNNHDGFPGYQVQLLAGGNVIASDNNTINPADGFYGTSVVSYTASANDPNLGKPLQIRLIDLNINPGRQITIDNVTLTATAVPEPNSILGLLAVGTFGAVSVLRKKLKPSK